MTHRVVLAADIWPDRTVVRLNLPEHGWAVAWSLETKKPGRQGWHWSDPIPVKGITYEWET